MKTIRDFVHLHLHTEYSLLDGACRIADIPKAVKRLNQSAAAITDHANMHGAVNFYLECMKEGIKPIIGCEIYVAEPEYVGHLILLAENNAGYKNLMYIVSATHIDFNILKERSSGLIALSGCASGYLFRAAANGDTDGAGEYVRKLAEIFGRKNFFIEIQNHNMPEQHTVNKKLADIAKIYNIKLVATNNTHYINSEDAEVRRILTCIRENKIVGEFHGESDSYLQTGDGELYLKSAEQMAELFGGSEYAGAIENTVMIAERCNVMLDFTQTYLPKYEPPENIAPGDYLRQLSREGLSAYILAQEKNNTPIDVELYEKRLNYELDTIEAMGYIDYYLIVWDFINYAKSQNIPVGPGRGSGAGSLAAFCTGITDIDPIKYDLFFERFLNPERISMPDFDIDLCQERRGEVITYVIDKYKGRAAHIIAFGTMAARGVVRDVGRVTGLNPDDIDYIARLIPQEPGMTLDKALEVSKELRSLYDNADYAKKLIDTSKKLEGMPRHASVHAAGIVITDKPIREYVPVVANSAGTAAVVTQYAMDIIADLGLLKIDFLGLRYLTIIDYALREIKKNRAYSEFDIDKIDLNDDNVYNLYASGRTDGVFQFESVGMKNLLTSLKPESFDDIIAAVALFRPGPMESIPVYIKSRHGASEIDYKLPQLKPILEPTYGCIIYQEQVMQIFRTLAGYSYGRADIVRRAMSKKNSDAMQEERAHFLVGCVKNNIDADIASKIFDEMSEFANYAFNKCHAAAYALVSYRTAYLKRYYPKEFFAALLSSVLSDSNKADDYMRDCARWGVKIYPPDINLSSTKFAVEGSGLRYGLLAVKNTGAEFIKKIIGERARNGKYLSLTDFLDRIEKSDSFEINKRQAEALIRSGAFDSLGNREKLIESYENIIDGINAKKRHNVSGQIDLFSDVVQVSIASDRTRQNKENEVQKNKENKKDNKENEEKREMRELEILYLKVADTDGREYKKVLSLIEIFEGRTAVKIYEEKTKKVFARTGMGVDLNPVFINELKDLLGEDSVKIIQK